MFAATAAALGIAIVHTNGQNGRLRRFTTNRLVRLLIGKTSDPVFAIKTHAYK